MAKTAGTSPLKAGRPPRDRGRIGIALALLIIAGGMYYAYWSLVEHRFTAVTEHQLYQSAEMQPSKLLRVAEKHGIRSVIDLRLSEDNAALIEAEQLALEGSGVEYFHLPTGHEPSEKTVIDFLNIVGDPENRPVLVHCSQGTGRSVLFGAIYRIEFENWDNEAARRSVEPLHWRGNFGPDSVKGQYLISYEPHHPALVFNTDP